MILILILEIVLYSILASVILIVGFFKVLDFFIKDEHSIRRKGFSNRELLAISKYPFACFFILSLLFLLGVDREFGI